MPLRDHFHPPLRDQFPWDGVHGGWPALMAFRLNDRLPPRYVASPRIRLSASFETDKYEVRVFDNDSRTLVAAVEIVSPANKDSADHRRTFVAKCEALLQQGVSVAIVDLVTAWRANLYAEVLERLSKTDPSVGDAPPSLYAVELRWRRRDPSGLLDAWAYPLAVGQPLPTVPLWLAEDLAVPLDLEGTYEETCWGLRIV